MKTSAWVLVVLVACLPRLAAAEDMANVRYAGNSLGKQVCRAVVEDDVRKLQQALRAYRNSLASGYLQSEGPRGVAQDFTCNGLALQAFSFSIGARKVSAYFAADAGRPIEQLAATAE